VAVRYPIGTIEEKRRAGAQGIRVGSILDVVATNGRIEDVVTVRILLSKWSCIDQIYLVEN
jgi:hypothetical protein